MLVEPKKDVSTVTPEGVRKQKMIAGVSIRPAITHVDERGTLTEIFNPAWGYSPEPLVYIYQFTIRPGKVKGWVVHKLQEDRIFVNVGTLKIVLYDSRPDSPTYGTVNELFLSDASRSLINFPPGVYHALQNIGLNDAMAINMPTRPYNHDDPDKYRLPVDNDVIPYKFTNTLGY